MPSLYGGRLVDFVPRTVATDPAAFLDLLARERVTILNQTPSAFAPLMREAVARRPGLALRYVIFGGGNPPPRSTATPWRDAYPAVELVNMYGITEDHRARHRQAPHRPGSARRRRASNIGGPIPTTTAYVLDGRLRLVPIGVAGELCVGGGGVGRGYLGRADLTRDRFIPNPYRPGERLYRSGDLVRRRPDGGDGVPGPGRRPGPGPGGSGSSRREIRSHLLGAPRRWRRRKWSRGSRSAGRPNWRRMLSWPPT